MFRTAAFTAVCLCLLALPIHSRAANGPIRIPGPGEGYQITKNESSRSAPRATRAARTPRRSLPSATPPQPWASASSLASSGRFAGVQPRGEISDADVHSQQPVHTIRAAVDHHAAAARHRRKPRRSESSEGHEDWHDPV